MARKSAVKAPATNGSVRVSEQTASPGGYDGQLGVTEIAEILKAHRDNAAEARAAFLVSHPHFIACSVAGCEGLVGPNYQRVTPEGRKYGFCPRRQVHARLMPQVFVSR